MIQQIKIIHIKTVTITGNTNYISAKKDNLIDNANIKLSKQYIRKE